MDILLVLFYESIIILGVCYFCLRYGAAEVDCTASLELDRTYVKALARRATARYKLGKLELAKVDYEEVLIIQPNNKQAITELQKIDKVMFFFSSRIRMSSSKLKVVYAEFVWDLNNLSSDHFVIAKTFYYVNVSHFGFTLLVP